MFAYAANVNENFRWAASGVDRIFKDVKPGEPPFELPIRFQLFINRKTVNAPGFAIPQGLLLRADRVIE